jgi:uncharacterized membrane protein YphA (DoxX/SURF4 family)
MQSFSITPSFVNARWLSRSAGWALAAIFIASSLPKLRNPQLFLDSVYGYELVGPNMGIFVAIIVPWLELVIAANLLTGIFLEASFLAAFILAAMFTFANTWAVVHGLKISCGCFGADPSMASVSWTTVAISAAIGLARIILRSPRATGLFVV